MLVLVNYTNFKQWNNSCLNSISNRPCRIGNICRDLRQCQCRWHKIL